MEATAAEPRPDAAGPGTVAVQELAQEAMPAVKPAEAGLSGKLYTALTWLVAPALAAHMASRRWRGRETAVSLRERWSLSMKPRKPGHVLWFHAVSIGESAVALPVVHRCLQEHPDVTILFTTGTVEAYSLLDNAVPKESVALQFLPLDMPWAVHRFLSYWRPAAAVFVESELWPNLIRQAHHFGVKMALLNARMSSESFLKWHNWSAGRELIGGALSHFSLIVPQSDLDVGRFRLLGAELWQMPGWCADLKYAAAMGSAKEAVAGRTHSLLAKQFPGVLTVLVPRHPWRCPGVVAELAGQGLRALLWSETFPGNLDALRQADVLLVDMVGELPLLFSVSEVAFIGGSLFDGSRGHNLAEAAVAGCAVLVGPYAGHFSQMAEELNHAAHSLSLGVLPPGFEEGSPTVDASFTAGLPLPDFSPMQRFGSPDVARGLQRQSRPGSGEELAADGLPSLEEELAGRRHSPPAAVLAPTATLAPPLLPARADPASLVSQVGSRLGPRAPSGLSHSSREPEAGNGTQGDTQGSPVTPRIRGSGPRAADVDSFGSPAFSEASTEPSGPASRTSSPYRSGFTTPARCRPRTGAASPESPYPLQIVDSHGATPASTAPSFERFEAHLRGLTPAHQLPQPPHGPCVWTVRDGEELAAAIAQLFLNPGERRSRGHAASCAAADLAANLVSTVWDLLDARVVRPALAEAAAREAA
eukprot:jgi/Tetstr1/422827/TSEL_013618.t1